MDLIDTAIVIKNIPIQYPEADFKTKLFPQLGLVPPYAFNYHRDKTSGSFHGLAFANFKAPHEAEAAVVALNNFRLDTRQLLVELKKRLPAEEAQRRPDRRIGHLWHENSFLMTLEGSVRHGRAVEGQPAGIQALDPAVRPQIISLLPVVETPPTGRTPPLECVVDERYRFEQSRNSGIVHRHTIVCIQPRKSRHGIDVSFNAYSYTT
jgi:hypothetical protein